MANQSTAATDALSFYAEAAKSNPFPAETVGYREVDPLSHAMSRVPMRTPRRLKIICCGAGVSGLNLAHEVETGGFANCDLQIYEKNSALGGTWFENRYPGCACDIPIHNYQFSWAPNPHFPSFYTGSRDICEYLNDVADQHNLRKYITTSHKVLGAKWIEERQKWQVQLVRTDGRELVKADGNTREGESGEPFIEECDIFINASGAYNNWRWPTIPNRESFKGAMVHSAIWPATLDLTGQEVILIGNGSTGIQILPAILDKVDKVYVLLRSRTWVTPALANRFAGENGANKIFTDQEKGDWSRNPDEYFQYRKEIENELNARFRLYLQGSEAQKNGRAFTEQKMTNSLAAKPELASQLIPDFPVGCRRPSPGSGYLEALCSPKVEIIWGEIDTFNETGLKTASGRQVDADTIICATGFNMGFVPRFPIIGSHGRDLRDDWTDDLPTAYLSVTVRNMPNYFVMMGPTSPLGHGSIIGSIEHVTGYIRKLIRKLQTEAYSSLVPKSNVTTEWLEHARKWIQKTVWVQSCNSSFKNGEIEAPVISLHPGSRLHYFDLLENLRHEDYDWTPLVGGPGSLFAWLGDGFTEREAYQKGDLSYYLEDGAHLKQRSERD